jgi:hypothetical protein
MQGNAHDQDKDTAGEFGRKLADALSAKCIEAIEGFPAAPKAQDAIARIVARRLAEWAEGN